MSGAPGIVADAGRESPRPLMQMAPVAAQSVVAGSTMVTLRGTEGLTVTFQRWFLPASTRRAPVTAPFVTVNAESRSVR